MNGVQRGIRNNEWGSEEGRIFCIISLIFP